MSNQELLTDEYVADLLAKDAQDCSLKFSTMGMDAYRSSKKPANHPKPNMRFLRNVIKDTNSHNAALLAKEAAESQARLEQLDRPTGLQRDRESARPKDIRNRQIGSINAILNGKRKLGDSEAVSSRNRPGKEERSEPRQHRSSSSRKETDRGRGREPDSRDDKEDRSHRRKRRRRDESASGDNSESQRRSHRRESSRHGRSRSPSRRERRHRERSTSRHRRPRSSNRRESSRRHGEHRDRRSSTPEKNAQPAHMSDSDPLDDFIGPAPPPKNPVRTKGRGTISAFSGIDQRFAEGYDPRLDVEMEEQEDTSWPDAVEAFRDRQKLRQAQEQRMREAGFSEEELTRWKEGPKDKAGKTEADVKWVKAGEKREWDVGKAFEE